jgi:type I restriction enzyme S subunit
MKVIKNWRIEPFAKVINDMTGGNPKIQQKDYLPSGVLPIIDQGQKDIAGYVNDLELSCKAPNPCIIFGDHTKILKYVDKPFAMGADGTKILVTSDELYPKYAFYYLQQVRLPDNLGYSRHFKFLKECSIPFPSIPEQKRIAAILDKVDAVRRKRQETIRLLDEFLRSVFLEMFGDPVRNEKGWEVASLKDVVDFISGGTPSKQEANFWNGKIPWVSPKDMKRNILLDSIDHISEEAVVNSNLRKIPLNSILIVVRGMILAHSIPIALTRNSLTINQDIKALITRIKNIQPMFLLYLLLTSKTLLLQLVSTAAHGTKRIETSSLENLNIIIPPYSLQIKFIKIVETIERQKAYLEKSDLEMKKSFNSMMQKAFRGEL